MIRKHSNQDSLVYKALMPLLKQAEESNPHLVTPLKAGDRVRSKRWNNERGEPREGVVYKTPDPMYPDLDEYTIHWETADGLFSNEEKHVSSVYLEVIPKLT